MPKRSTGACGATGAALPVATGGEEPLPFSHAASSAALPTPPMLLSRSSSYHVSSVREHRATEGRARREARRRLGVSLAPVGESTEAGGEEPDEAFGLVRAASRDSGLGRSLEERSAEAGSPATRSSPTQSPPWIGSVAQSASQSAPDLSSDSIQMRALPIHVCGEPGAAGAGCAGEGEEGGGRPRCNTDVLH